MSTEMELSPASTSKQMLTYAQLFATKESKTAQIKRATTRLGVATGKALSPATLEIWAQNLQSYSTERLIGAFERAEGEVAAFPAVAHLKAYLDQAEFDHWFSVVLVGMPKHGPDWKEVEAWKSADKWDFHSAEAIAKGDRILIPGIWHPAIPAPELPERMVKALGLFGDTGKMRDGLIRLNRDSPAFWTGDTERNIGDHSRLASLIRKDLYACWLRAQ